MSLVSTPRNGGEAGLPSDAEFIRVLRDYALSGVDIREETIVRAGSGALRGLSTTELQDACQLSHPSVGRLVKRFEDVLIQTRDASGRRWNLDAEAGCILTLEIAQDRTKIGLHDLYGRFLSITKIKPAKTADEAISDAVRGLKASLAGRSSMDVVGVGVSLAAPVEHGRGVRMAGRALQSAVPTDQPWDDLELMRVRDHLVDRLDWDHAPVLLENDANVEALAEYVWGAASPPGVLRNVLHVEWSRGIGAGLILEGQLYRGEGIAGEIGHTVVAPDGAMCERCGRRGCLEAVAGLEAIARGSRDGTPATDEELFSYDDLAAVALRAHVPESEEGRSFGRAAAHVASVLGPLINALNPQVVVIGGDVGRTAYDVVRPELLRALPEHTMRPALSDVALRGARLSANTALLGAASLILRPATTNAPDHLLAYLQRIANRI